MKCNLPCWLKHCWHYVQHDDKHTATGVDGLHVVRTDGAIFRCCKCGHTRWMRTCYD